jgi:hypothetical protein
MDFLRLYLGEIATLVLVLVILFVAAAIALRYGGNRRMIRNVRNLCVAAAIAAFVSSLTYSLLVNRATRGRIDRSYTDQDQKAFEQRHSDQTK